VPVDRFFTPEDRCDLIVTHNFLVGWLVRHALGAPADRWLGLNAAHASLTVIRCRDGRPPALVSFNDLAHLPAELRWTGFPPGACPVIHVN
jgi:serine/threonine-protein phosphatase PGAM5